MGAPMSTVLHTMQRYLPLSEQFVHTLITRSRHRGVVVSRDAVENRSAFPFRPVYPLTFVPRHDPPTLTERRLLTAGLTLVALRHRAKVIHHHHAYRLSDVTGVVRRLRLPLIVSVHGHDVTAFASEWPGAVVEPLRRADAVVVPSRFLIAAVTEFGVASERIRVIPSGVDTTFFAPAPLDPTSREALFVGRFVEKKGLDVLLAAWPAVRQRVPGATLRLLGYGPLEELARAAQNDGVELTPTDPSRRAGQVRDAIRRARVVVTPSRTAADGDVETLLLVNLEAQASGRPVVTTRHGGIPEFVDEGSTALLVRENDAPQLTDALARVLVDDDLAARMSRAGPEWTKRFDWTETTAAMDALYDELTR